MNSNDYLLSAALSMSRLCICFTSGEKDTASASRTMNGLIYANFIGSSILNRIWYHSPSGFRSNNFMIGVRYAEWTQCTGQMLDAQSTWIPTVSAGH